MILINVLILGLGFYGDDDHYRIKNITNITNILKMPKVGWYEYNNEERVSNAP